MIALLEIPPGRWESTDTKVRLASTTLVERRWPPLLDMDGVGASLPGDVHVLMDGGPSVWPHDDQRTDNTEVDPDATSEQLLARIDQLFAKNDALWRWWRQGRRWSSDTCGATSPPLCSAVD